tara:strand:- start:30 stop:269 length:240 start_codon:yes stop_codon:yes gene_type:complete
MGEARRKLDQGLKPKNTKDKQTVSLKTSNNALFSLKNREKFIEITKFGAWIGIGLLVIFWVIVRFVGPFFGWWIPADTR